MRFRVLFRYLHPYMLKDLCKIIQEYLQPAILTHGHKKMIVHTTTKGNCNYSEKVYKNIFADNYGILTMYEKNCKGNRVYFKYHSNNLFYVNIRIKSLKKSSKRAFSLCRLRGSSTRQSHTLLNF